MNPTTNAIPITIVSRDRSLLRDTAWTLSNFGYAVTTSTDWSRNSVWRTNPEESLWLLDARDEEAHATLTQGSKEAYCYKITISSGDELATAGLLAIGADDVIRFPLNVGELLSRLRYGVRRLEFERRRKAIVQENSSAMLSARSLIKHMNAQSYARKGAQRLVSFEIDFFDKLRSELGCSGTLALVRGVAEELRRTLPEGAPLYHLSEGAFAACLGDLSDADCVEAAQRVGEGVASRGWSEDGPVDKVTVSSVVVEWNGVDAPAEFLSHLEDVLVQTRSYGGDCVLEAGVVEQELAEWKQVNDSCQAFQELSASDLMEPLPILLRSGQNAVFELGDTTNNRPFPPCAPVVDDQNQLMGVVAMNDLPKYGDQALDESLIQETENCVPSNTTLNELFDAFSSLVEDYLIVLEEGAPVGYLTSQGLASLAIDPINADTYRRGLDAGSSIADLVVPVEPGQVQTAGLSA